MNAAGPTEATHWFARMLDDLDYGMPLVADDRVVLHANHVAAPNWTNSIPSNCLAPVLQRVHDDPLSRWRGAGAIDNSIGFRSVARVLLQCPGRPGE